MKYAGIDIASEKHFVAVVDEASEVLQKSTNFAEDAGGYARLFEVLGAASEVATVAMEATGHYWKNVFAALVAKGYPVALLNPLRTNRFAGEELGADIADESREHRPAIDGHARHGDLDRKLGPVGYPPCCGPIAPTDDERAPRLRQLTKTAPESTAQAWRNHESGDVLASHVLIP